MWLEVVYKPTSLFSLRKSDATNPAAKTLISPSPYAVKMALLNAAITFFSKDFAKSNFSMIRDLEILFSLPEYTCVNNCFIKIQKEPKKKETGQAFQSAVAFREYIYYQDVLKLLVKINDPDRIDILKSLFIRVNYFGKRGCFFQFISFNEYKRFNSNDEYCNIFSQETIGLNSKGILIYMDDFANDAAFINADIYSKENAKRKSYMYCFNVRQQVANRNFTLFKKLSY
jgi:hypothetical protein